MFIYEKSISHLIKNLQYIQVIYIYMHACTYMGVYLCTRIYNRVFITTIVVMKIRVEILWLLGFLWLRVFWIQNEKPPFCKTQLLINSQKSRSWRSWVAFFLCLEFFFQKCATRPLIFWSGRYEIKSEVVKIRISKNTYHWYTYAIIDTIINFYVN